MENYGSVRNRAMLVRFSASAWSGRKFDKKATKEIADFHKTDEKVGRYNKLLLPQQAESFKALHAKIAEGRQLFYGETAPWDDDGERALKSTNYINFGTKMARIERELEGLKPTFLDQYTFLKEQAKLKLNGLYREEDYPDRSKLREMFSIDVKYSPIPDASHFIVDLADADLAVVRAQIAADTKARIAHAMEEPYRRLADGVVHMGSKLSGAKTCPCRNCKGKEFSTDDFGDSAVNNLVSLCETLPRLNLTDDPYLDSLIEQVKVGLTQFKPDIIRDSKSIRDSLAARANEIFSDLRGYMAA